MTLDLDKARRLLDQGLRRRRMRIASDADWEFCLERGWQEGSLAPLDKAFRDEDDLVGEMLEAMWIRRQSTDVSAEEERHHAEREAAAARRAWSPSPPEWWPAECERALETFREDQRRTLADFDLVEKDGGPRFVKLREVRSLVHKLATQEPIAGERLQLRVPTRRYKKTSALDFVTVTGWRGRWPDPVMDFIRDRPPQREVLGEGRFARLYDRTRVLTSMTGCDEEEAVAFLFCDKTPWMPWIELAYDGRCDATMIRVRHPEVSADEVAAAYRKLRPGGALFLGVHRQRRRRLWPERVETFVDAYRRQHAHDSWDATYRAFCETYGEKEAKKKYTTLEGFQRVYYFRKQKPERTTRPTLADLPDEE